MLQSFWWVDKVFDFLECCDTYDESHYDAYDHKRLGLFKKIKLLLIN